MFHAEILKFKITIFGVTRFSLDKKVEKNIYKMEILKVPQICTMVAQCKAQTN